MSLAPKTFRSAASFAQHWQGGCTIEEMLSGETARGRFPSALRRQDKLVGHAVDAALVTALHSMLRWGHSVGYLPEYFFNFQRAGAAFTKEKFASDISAIRKQYEHDAQALDDALFAYLAPLARRGAKSPLANHRDLVTDTRWNEFREQRTYLREAWKAFQEEVDAAHVGGRFETPPAPPPSVPDDPRLLACNERVRQWIEIRDPHIKTRQSIASKIARRSEDSRPCDPAVDIRDVNRLMVLPDSPRTADRFLSYLSHLLEHHHAKEGAPARSLVEPWKIKVSGQFDRMAYLALAKDAAGRDSANAQRGMVAEVKIVAREMEKADRITSPIYAVARELERIERFLPDSGNPESRRQCAEEQVRFAALFDREKKKFEERCAANLADPKKYRFPNPIPPGKRSSRAEYVKLREALLTLNQQAHIDFLGKERGADDWARLFLDVAGQQNAAIDATRSLAGKREAGGSPFTRIPEHMLRQAGASMPESWRAPSATSGQHAARVRSRKLPTPADGQGERGR